MELSLKDYFYIIIKRWKIILSFVLAGILIMFVWSYFIVQDKYEIGTTSSLEMIIEDSGEGSGGGEIIASNKEEQAFNRLISKFKTHIVEADYIFDDIWNQDLDQVFDSYDTITANTKADFAINTQYKTIGEWAQSLGYSKKSLKKNVHFTFSNEDKGFFSISIVTKDPQFGVALLATYNLVSREKVQAMSEPASLNVVVKAQYYILDHPDIPEEQDVIRPNLVLNMLLGALVGLVLAVSVILLINHYDVKIKSEEDIREKFDVPVIASIPDVSDIKKGN